MQWCSSNLLFDVLKLRSIEKDAKSVRPELSLKGPRKFLVCEVYQPAYAALTTGSTRSLH
jgi:hypothetical protein